MGPVSLIPENFTVLHRPKDHHAFGQDVEQTLQPAFKLDTCLRTLWISSAPIEGEAIAGNVFRGRNAYEFLLRVACGLESAIAGETEIFGQIKAAWNQWSQSDAESSHSLAPWIQRLFEDTKEIRSLYLVGLGASTYGSQVRQILTRPRDENGERSQPLDSILMVGAGQMAASVLPYLDARQVYIWNRSFDRMKGLLNSLTPEHRARTRPLVSAASLFRTWETADVAVICIPSSTEGKSLDRLLINTKTKPKTILHLGCQNPDSDPWQKLSKSGVTFYSLREFFELEQSQSEVRSLLLMRAGKACTERATLRFIPGTAGGSVTLAHGWEDLAAFL